MLFLTWLVGHTSKIRTRRREMDRKTKSAFDKASFLASPLCLRSKTTLKNIMNATKTRFNFVVYQDTVERFVISVEKKKKK